jgi:hypothetical protein
VFDTLGTTLLESSLASGDLASKLADAFGGLENLATAAATYYEAFYSEQERTATATRQLTETLGKLGIALPNTAAADALAQYRALVDAQDINTESGRTAYAALVTLSGGFAQLVASTQTMGLAATDAAAALDKAASDTADALAKVAEALATTNQGWQDQIDVLTGAQTERRLALRDAGDDSTRDLMRVVYGLQDLKTAADAAADAATKQTDNAFAALERAVAAQRKTIETQLSAAQSLASEVSGIFDSLKSAVDDLYRSVDSTAQQSAAQARAFISSSLSGALATGSLPDSRALQDAISAARGGIDAQQFTSQFEADRARLVLAGELSQLKDIAGDQLSEAERQIWVLEDQLEALDKTLQTAREQIDVMRGIDISVISVADAVRNLGVSLAAELSALGGALAAGAAAKAAAMQPYSVNDSGAQRSAKVEAQTGVKIGAGDSAMVAAAKALYQSVNGGASTAEFNAAAAGVGGDLYAALGWDGSREHTERMRTQYSFAVGTNRVPRDMVANIHEGEMIVPAAYNPATSGIGGGNERLERLVEALTAEVTRLRADVSKGNENTKQLADQFDSVSAGGNALATEVMT